MKVLIYLLIGFIIQQSSCLAQDQKAKSFLSAKIGHLQIDGYSPRLYGGVEFDVIFPNRIGIHYSFLFGKDYFHMPLAPVGGLFTGIAAGLFFSSSDSTKTGLGTGIIVGLLTAIIPEGISYNIPISHKLQIAPYISPLQFEVIRRNNNSKGYAGGAIGIKLHQYLISEKMRLSPYVEMKIHYSKTPNPGFSAGLNVAVSLNKKNAR